MNCENTIVLALSLSDSGNFQNLIDTNPTTTQAYRIRPQRQSINAKTSQHMPWISPYHGLVGYHPDRQVSGRETVRHKHTVAGSLELLVRVLRAVTVYMMLVTDV